MSWLCLPRSTVSVPYVGLGSGNRRERTVNLTSMIVPLQFYFLSASRKCGCMTDPPSIAACTALLDNFGDSALVSSYNPWTFVDFHQKEHICSDIVKRYKSVWPRSGLDESIVVSSTVVPGELPKTLLCVKYVVFENDSFSISGVVHVSCIVN